MDAGRHLKGGRGGGAQIKKGLTKRSSTTATSFGINEGNESTKQSGPKLTPLGHMGAYLDFAAVGTGAAPSISPQPIPGAKQNRVPSAASSKSSVGKPRKLPPVTKTHTQRKGPAGNKPPARRSLPGTTKPLPGVGIQTIPRSSQQHPQTGGTSSKTNKKALPQISQDGQKNSLSHIIEGRLDSLPKERTSIVRIFLSSTFSDYRLERNSLCKYAYPELKEYCSALGMEFQVVDLRWGIPDEASDDHSVEDICLREITRCNEISQGPYFVMMLGDRYGYRPVPASLDKVEFETLLNLMETADREHVNHWYKEDENNTPPVFILQAITKNLPKFGSGSAEEQATAREAWWEATAKLQTVFRMAAQQAFDKKRITDEQKQRYFKSVTEGEIRHGVCPKNNGNFVAFMRQLTNIDEADAELKRYIDIKNEGDSFTRDEEATILLKHCGDYAQSLLQPENVFKYSVKWENGGITPEKHSSYAEQFCRDFVQVMKSRIDESQSQQKEMISNQLRYGTTRQKPQKLTPSVKESGTISANYFLVAKHATEDLTNQLQEMEELDDAIEFSMKSNIFDEVLCHSHHANQQMKTFVGRQKEQAMVMNNLLVNGQSHCVVHGETGSGKTAFLASIAHSCNQQLPNAAIVLRFIGRTTDSFSAFKVVKSIISQMCLIYGFTMDKKKTVKYESSVAYLNYLINVISIAYCASKPLILIIDGLDKLQNAKGELNIEWLPKTLRGSVKIIVSIRTQNLDTLRYIYKTSWIVKLCALDASEVEEYIRAYQQLNSRTLTAQQMQTLLPLVMQLPMPLFINLTLRDSFKWRSYSNIKKEDIGNTAQEFINNFFASFERIYGATFTKYCLGYKTAARFGISENEWEDVMSMNDEVLRSVYQYHNPPIEGYVTIPAFMTARVKYDLAEYVTQKRVDGKVVYGWKFAIFDEVARERYVAPAKVKLHSDLAKMLSVEEPYRKTIHLEKRNITVENADRDIMLQPLTPTNIRRLMSVPYHLYEAGLCDELKIQTVCNPKFLECFLLATSMPELLNFIESYANKCQDAEINLVLAALKFERSPIEKNPKALGLQIYPYLRSSKSEIIQTLANAIITKAEKPLLLAQASFNSYTNPALTSTLPDVHRVVLVDDKKELLLTHTASKKLKLVNQVSGESKTMCGKIETIVQACFSGDGSKLFLLTANDVKVVKVSRGKLLETFKNTANSKEKLSSCIVSNSAGDEIFLAGPARLASFRSGDANNKFVARAAMGLSGCTKTTNLCVYNEKNTMSSHLLGKIGAVVIWNADEQKIVCKIAMPAEVISGFLYQTQDQSCVICGCVGGHIVYCDIKDAKVIQDIKTDGFLSCVPSSFDVQTNCLVVVNESNSVILLKAQDDCIIKLRSFEVSNISSLDFNGLYIVYGQNDGYIGMMNVLSDVPMATQIDSDEVSKVVVTFDDTILTCSGNGDLRQWDLDGLVESIQNYSDTSNDSRTLHGITDTGRFAFTESSKEALLESKGNFSIWNLQSGENVISFSFKSPPVRKMAIVGQEPKQMVLVSCEDNSLRFLTSGTGEEVDNLKNAFDFVVVSDLLYIVGEDANGRIALLEYETSRRFLSGTVPLLEKLICKVEEYSARIVGNVDGVLYCLLSGRDSTSNAFHQLIAVKIGTSEEIKDTSIIENGENTQFICLSKDAVVILSEHSCTLWNPFKSSSATDKPQLEKALLACEEFAKSNKTTTVATSSNHEHIAIGSSKGKVLILCNPVSAGDLQQMDTISSHKAKITHLEFIQGGAYLVSASLDKTMAVYNVANGSPQCRVDTHMSVLYFGISPDETALIAQVEDDQKTNRAILFHLNSA